VPQRNIRKFYIKACESISLKDSFACEELFDQPEALQLTTQQLRMLLERAYKQIGSSAGHINYSQLATQIISKIVPRVHPQELNQFIGYSLLPDVPCKVFKAVVANVRLLNLSQVNALLAQLIASPNAAEENWLQINDQILQLALNLPEGLCLSRLSAFKNRLREASTFRSNDLISVSLAATAIIDAKRTSSSIVGAVRTFHDFCIRVLRVRFQVILLELESTLRAINYFETGPPHELTQILEQLHSYSKLHLGQVSEYQRGIEDLFFYARGDLGALVEARLKFHQPSPVGMRQILGLLHVADLRNPESDRAIMAFFKSFLVAPKRSWPEQSTRIQLYLKSTSLMPKLKIGDPCSDTLASVEVYWNLPEASIFIENDENREMIYDFFNLPALFLYHAFGIPVEDCKVDINQAELPDIRELIDIVNFLGQRWCSIRGQNFIYRIKTS
jgi:hypothetical protein